MEALLHHTGLKALRGCALEGGNLKGHKRVKLQKDNPVDHLCCSTDCVGHVNMTFGNI